MKGININVHTPPELKRLLDAMHEKLAKLDLARAAWFDGAFRGFVLALLFAIVLYLLLIYRRK